ncbi:hypothetical protein ACFE04_022313 [Oxalis oulophora]
MYPPSEEEESRNYSPHEVYHPGLAPVSGVPTRKPPRNYVSAPYFRSNRVALALEAQWSSGFCHCCDDPVNSCATSGALYCLLLLTGFPCLYSCFYRSKLRGQYDLPEEPCVDCLVHCCCETCALCQEYRELKNRGFDMGIGWEANMDRQNRGVTLAPIVTPGMSR